MDWEIYACKGYISRVIHDRGRVSTRHPKREVKPSDRSIYECADPYVNFRWGGFKWTGRGCLRILLTPFTVKEHIIAPATKYNTPAERV